jgi:hypothetical protein
VGLSDESIAGAGAAEAFAVIAGERALKRVKGINGAPERPLSAKVR